MTSILDDGQEEYTGRTIKALDASGQRLEGRYFDQCQFIGCRFHEAVLFECRFHNCQFEDCDLSLADVTDSAFRDVTISRSQALGINWTQASWHQAGILNCISFDKSVLNYATFAGLRLDDFKVVNCTARHVDFTDATLIKSSFHGSDLLDSRFFHTDLTDADFTSARNYEINASENTLKKTKFSLPEALSLLHSLDIILED